MERSMIKNLVVVASGGALAFGLAGAISPAIAQANVAHPAGVTRANLPMPGGTPIIRDSTAQLGDPDDGGQLTQATARLGDPDDGGQVTQATAQHSDPDDGGQVQVFAARSDPDDGGQ
jgi:hypothetical protein